MIEPTREKLVASLDYLSSVGGGIFKTRDAFNQIPPATYELYKVPQFGEIREAGDEGGDFLFILK